jgi:hypothetical protein
MIEPSPDTSRLWRQPRSRSRGRAALAAGALALAAAMPAATAIAQEQNAGHARVSVRDSAGRAVTLLPRLTLPQLASLLGMSPEALVAQIEAAAGQAGLAPIVSGLPVSPRATVGELIDRLRAAGVDPSVVQRLLESLLGPYIAGGEQLQSTIAQILADLEANGELEVVAGELGLSPEQLKATSLTPVTDETVADTLDTTIDHLAGLLASAGSTTVPLGPSTPVVEGPVASPEGGTTLLLGLPLSGGVSMTTVHSTAPSVLGFTTSVPDNAFTIVSIKLNRSGSIVETVKVPWAGRLSISANGRARVATRSGSRTRNVGVRVRPVATAIAAGTHSIVLLPRTPLARARMVTVSLVTSYKPSGGTANTKHKTVTFRRSKGARRH